MKLQAHVFTWNNLQPLRPKFTLMSVDYFRRLFVHSGYPVLRIYGLGPVSRINDSPFDLAVMFLRIGDQMTSKLERDPTRKDIRARCTKNLYVEKRFLMRSGTVQISMWWMFHYVSRVEVHSKVINLVVAYHHFESGPRLIECELF